MPDCHIVQGWNIVSVRNGANALLRDGYTLHSQTTCCDPISHRVMITLIFVKDTR